MSLARRLLVLAVVTGLLAAVASAAAALSPRRERLPSGLTVLVRENSATPVVAASLFVRVGSRWETEDDAGITHLLQQVLLKGTATRSALEVAESAEALGGGISASADMDFSEVRATALARNWKKMLELLADVALHPTLPEAEIEGERQAMLTALRSRQDQPFPRAMDTVMAKVYGEHPYGRPILGRPVALAKIDRAALVSHHRRFYRAPRMILAVSGDVDARDVVEEIARLFAAAPAGEGDADPTPAAAVARADRTVIVKPSAQAQVVVAFLAPPTSHPDYAAVKVLATALGGGMAGRLFTEVRDKQGLAYSTGGAYPSRLGPGVLYMQLGTAPANQARAEAAMLGELTRIQREPLGPGELARAKAYLLGQFALDRRTNARLAWYDAFFEALGVGPDFADRYVQAVEAITAEDVLRVARTYLAAPTIVTLGPAGK
ncbi:MAG TPA: pitrilysin family protein [Methylomirabilota bacterium]|nr:pitrilysin family protein [Methylomirabilota bacterium]